MLPAATACNSGFQRWARAHSTKVTDASARRPRRLPSCVTSSIPAAPPPTTTTRCNASSLERPLTPGTLSAHVEFLTDEFMADRDHGLCAERAAPIGPRPAGTSALVVASGRVFPLKLGTDIGIGVAADDFPVLDHVSRLNTNGRTVFPGLAGGIHGGGSCASARAVLIKDLPRLSVSALSGHKRREQCAVHQDLSDEPLHVASPCTVAAGCRHSLHPP